MSSRYDSDEEALNVKGAGGLSLVTQQDSS